MNAKEATAASMASAARVCGARGIGDRRVNDRPAYGQRPERWANLAGRPIAAEPGTPMPSFDIVSEVDSHELTNAVDQANRELGNRFDFKGVDARVVLEDGVITQSAPSDFQLQQMTDILRARLIARRIDVRCLEFGDVETNVAGARQKITVKQGIERELARKIQSTLKEAKLKVDSQINGDKLRVNGKKRDDLQAA